MRVVVHTVDKYAQELWNLLSATKDAFSYPVQCIGYFPLNKKYPVSHP